ncbi:1027_t:CDS:2 [Ambispora gerdemannii]|uniref:1027_t:CDS:1 n=1 Tax=Ambispora gerdemannii TaxID=144530 RepID=A0A9N8Z6W8_9GLOM|nr:1027_t:CDS:2 [Ambispora gerdemannii]
MFEERAIEELIDTISNLYASPKLALYYLDYFKQKAKNNVLVQEAPEPVKHVEQACKELEIRSVTRFYQVESDYYEWELQRRAFRLLAPSRKHLCKSVIFENTHSTHDSIDDPNNSKYYCVIVQYIASINTQKLMNFVRALSDKKISKKHYNFRLASPEKSLELTGFGNGGVSPIGMRNQIPIILSKNILSLQPPIFYLGAGHIDWKLALPADNFVEKTHCYIADLS